MEFIKTCKLYFKYFAQHLTEQKEILAEFVYCFKYWNGANGVWNKEENFEVNFEVLRAARKAELFLWVAMPCRVNS